MSAQIHSLVLARRVAVERERAEATRRDEFLAAARGAKGDTGPMPDHEWKGSKLRFQKSDGEWGEWVDLRGKPGKAGKDGESVVRVVGGGSSVTAPGGTDLDALPDANPAITPDYIALRQNGSWVRMPWNQFIDLMPRYSVPANAATVNDEAITVNGEFVTVSR